MANVKRSTAYRYLEAGDGTFRAIDLDGEEVCTTEGAIGEPGVESRTELAWVGEAVEQYHAQLAAWTAAGYEAKTSVEGEDVSLPALVAAAFGVTLPAAYRRLLEGGSFAAYRGRKTRLPTYAPDVRVPVIFDDPTLVSAVAASSFAEDPRSKVFVPISTLGEEPGLLVMSTGDERCPVHLWMTSGTFARVAASLEEFLASLA